MVIAKDHRNVFPPGGNYIYRAGENDIFYHDTCTLPYGWTMSAKFVTPPLKVICSSINVCYNMLIIAELKVTMGQNILVYTHLIN